MHAHEIYIDLLAGQKTGQGLLMAAFGKLNEIEFYVHCGFGILCPGTLIKGVGNVGRAADDGDRKLNRFIGHRDAAHGQDHDHSKKKGHKFLHG